MTHIRLPLLLLSLVKMFAPGCAMASGDASGSKSAKDLKQSVLTDDSFDYDSEKRVWVDIDVSDMEGAPADHRVVEVLEQLDEEGFELRVIERGVTDESGHYDGRIKVPSYVKNVVVRVGVLGIDNSYSAALDGNGMIEHDFR